MNGPDLFLICPVCGTQIGVTYAKGQRRPTALDECEKLETCPLCGATLIRVINPTFDDKWNLENEVDFTMSQRRKLLDMTNKYSKSNSEKLKELTTTKTEDE